MCEESKKKLAEIQKQMRELEDAIMGRDLEFVSTEPKQAPEVTRSAGIRKTVKEV